MPVYHFMPQTFWHAYIQLVGREGRAWQQMFLKLYKAANRVDFQFQQSLARLLTWGIVVSSGINPMTSSRRFWNMVRVVWGAVLKHDFLK